MRTTHRNTNKKRRGTHGKHRQNVNKEQTKGQQTKTIIILKHYRTTHKDNTHNRENKGTIRTNKQNKTCNT